MTVNRALFSLANPEEGKDLAAKLVLNGWVIVATDETVECLARNNIQAESIYEFLNLKDRYSIPPTLHPQIEVSLSTDDDPDSRIDLVFDQTYGLDAGVDVGGHTLIALAVKGDRLVLTDRFDAERMSRVLDQEAGDVQALRRDLRRKALSKLQTFYEELNAGNQGKTLLENGENPYQVPSFLVITDKEDSMGLGSFVNLSTTVPCYTNLADLDCLCNLMVALSKAFKRNHGKVPYIAVAAKHGNPCGLATSWGSREDTIDKALWGNPLGIWGGELIVNFEIDALLAKKIVSSTDRERERGSAQWMLDVVAAADYSREALDLLQKRAARKIFQNSNLLSPCDAKLHKMRRQVRGGELVQPAHDYIPSIAEEWPDGEQATVDLLIAWAVTFWSYHGGNEVAIVKDSQLLGAGGGPSTVDAARVAVMRAMSYHDDISGSAFAADAFFPHVDAPQVLAEAGCKWGIVPRGGVRFAEIESFFHDNGIACVFLEEAARGFCRH